MTDILIVDDEEVLARTICQYLSKRGFDTRYAVSIKEALRLIDAGSFPRIAFVDYRIGRESGLDLLAKMRHRNKQAVVIMMTGHGDIAVAVNAMKGGAQDFLIKPVPLDNFAQLANAMIAKVSVQRTSTIQATPNGQPNNANFPGNEIVGRCAAVVTLRSTVSRIVTATSELRSSLPAVLITGESGTGKDLVARALHANSQRASRPYVSVNCASIPAELVESELFGHEKGAFADAKTERVGLFESADGGVLFLDDIGDMPLAAQAKLLRVLEDRAVRRVGSVRSQPVNVWVVAATNRHLADLVAEGAFRGDLMFRLQVLWIDVPPLRERDSDILILAEHFCELFAAQYGRPKPRLSSSVRAQLVEHRWPGNIRELKNVIERAVVLADDGRVEPQHITLTGLPAAETKGSLQRMEENMLRQALEKTNGNVTRAAANLGISRDTMRYRIEKFGLTSRQ